MTTQDLIPRIILCSRPLRVVPALLATVVLTASPALSAEWQWSVPDGAGRTFLWIPSDCARVKGVVEANHNMLEQGILEHRVMRRTLAELGFAEMWGVPMLDASFDFNTGAGQHFEAILSALAEVSGYVELTQAPVVPIGHSACASFPRNFAVWNPERTLAILSIRSIEPKLKSAAEVLQTFALGN